MELYLKELVERFDEKYIENIKIDYVELSDKSNILVHDSILIIYYLIKNNINLDNIIFVSENIDKINIIKSLGVNRILNNMLFETDVELLDDIDYIFSNENKNNNLARFRYTSYCCYLYDMHKSEIKQSKNNKVKIISFEVPINSVTNKTYIYYKIDTNVFIFLNYNNVQFDIIYNKLKNNEYFVV